MRILLVEPPISSKMVGYTRMIRPEPLALEYVAASVLPDHEVKILDLRVDPTPLESELASFQPDLVGTTGYTTDVPEMLKVLRKAKENDTDVITVVGGIHASLCSEDFDYDFVDVIVRGEGEVTFRELVETVEKRGDIEKVEGITYRENGKQIPTPNRKVNKNLDALPIPARHLTDHYRKKYHFHFWEDPYVVETARGCPYRCSFCSVWVFHEMKTRFRSPERVLQELKTIDSDMISFVDDEFFQNPRRAERIADLVQAEGIKKQYWAQVRADDVAKWPHLARKWRDVGMISIFLGLEKITDEDLSSVNKRTSVAVNDLAIKILQDDLGIDIWGSFIVDPQWTSSHFDSLIEYVRSKRIAFPSFTVLTPLPGTHFFREKMRELTTRNYEIFDLLHAVLPTKLPLDEFYSNMARLYANTSMSWNELLRRVRSGQIPISALGRIRELLKDVTNPQAYLMDKHEAEEPPPWKQFKGLDLPRRLKQLKISGLRERLKSSDNVAWGEV